MSEQGETAGAEVEICAVCKTGTIETRNHGVSAPSAEDQAKGSMGTMWFEDVCNNPDCRSNDSDLAPAADPTEGARLRHDG